MRPALQVVVRDSGLPAEKSDRAIGGGHDHQATVRRHGHMDGHAANQVVGLAVTGDANRAIGEVGRGEEKKGKD